MNKFIFCITLFPFSLLASGTSIGNGGDPLFEFLEASRRGLTDTLFILQTDSVEKDIFCRNPGLKEEQVSFCKKFFYAVEDQIHSLNSLKKKTPFTLSHEPLFVIGPDGEKMVVAAKTASGPQGAIEFNRDAIKTMIPTQVLFLIAHEFQHKVSFQNQFIGDNDPIGPFASGRELLDQVAFAIVETARRKGKVGLHFGMSDIYECRVEGLSQPIGSFITAPRTFFDESLNAYQSGFGLRPLDGTIYLDESMNSKIKLRFQVSEPHGCLSSKGGRVSQFQVVRSVMSEDGSFTETVLANQQWNGNPTCAGENPRFEISWERLSFTCTYRGSQSTNAAKREPYRREFFFRSK